LIRQETARSGHQILRIEGRLLASSIDPIREASVWAAKTAAQVKPDSVVCVLGAGCGYHLLELSRLLPKTRIVVLEPVREIADWVLAQTPDLGSLTFLVGDNPELDLETWSDALFAVSRVFIHGPTSQIHPAWTLRLSRFVLARDRTSFLTQIRARPELLAILDPSKIASMSDEIISIKSLNSLFKHEATDSQERRLWRALEELIR
jgi:hypothetical protein